MASKDPRIRSIAIKTGVVKRIAKEKTMYVKEAEQLAAKVEQMKSSGADIHDIKKQTEVMEESVSMVPDCKRRLKVGWQDLDSVLKAESDLADAEEYKAALAILEETSAAANS